MSTCLCGSCRRCRKRARIAANRAFRGDPRVSRDRIQKLGKKYGLSAAEYVALLDRQQDACALCRIPFEETIRACVDHDHKSGAVRGVLCPDCNCRLGYYEKDRDRHTAFEAYLRRVE